MPKKHATIEGEVTYREGDGMPIRIPEGEVELDVQDDSVTISWTAKDGSLGSAAMPLTQYEPYVESGGIKLKG